MDEKELDDLAASLSIAGVVQLLSVRPTDNGRFALVASHRRLLAHAHSSKRRIALIWRSRLSCIQAARSRWAKSGASQTICTETPWSSFRQWRRDTWRS